MTNEPEFLTLEDVIAIHDREVSRTGGSFGIRDMNLLQSAIGMPMSSFGGEFLHKDIFEMAAAYTFHIAQNQPFIDGNKRTGLLAALVFLDINGSPILTPSLKLYGAMVAIANREFDKMGLATLFRELATETS